MNVTHDTNARTVKRCGASKNSDSYFDKNTITCDMRLDFRKTLLMQGSNVTNFLPFRWCSPYVEFRSASGYFEPLPKCALKKTSCGKAHSALLDVSARGLNHSLEISGNPYKKSRNPKPEIPFLHPCFSKPVVMENYTDTGHRKLRWTWKLALVDNKMELYRSIPLNLHRVLISILVVHWTLSLAIICLHWRQSFFLL